MTQVCNEIQAMEAFQAAVAQIPADASTETRERLVAEAKTAGRKRLEDLDRADEARRATWEAYDAAAVAWVRTIESLQVAIGLFGPAYLAAVEATARMHEATPGHLPTKTTYDWSIGGPALAELQRAANGGLPFAGYKNYHRPLQDIVETQLSATESYGRG